MPNVELDSAPFKLLQPQSVLVEPVRPSGFQDGLYVFDEDFGFAEKTSMLCRLVAIGPGCVDYLKLGAVYVCPVYCWDDMVDTEGTVWHITHQQNLQCEIEGYDEACTTE